MKYLKLYENYNGIENVQIVNVNDVDYIGDFFTFNNTITTDSNKKYKIINNNSKIVELTSYLQNKFSFLESKFIRFGEFNTFPLQNNKKVIYYCIFCDIEDSDLSLCLLEDDYYFIFLDDYLSLIIDGDDMLDKFTNSIVEYYSKEIFSTLDLITYIEEKFKLK